MAADEDGLLLRLMVFIVVRILFFAGGTIAFALTTYLCLALASRRRIYRELEDVPLFLVLTPGFWLLALGIGVVSAVAGPPLYARHTMRGRGTLAAVKQERYYEEP